MKIHRNPRKRRGGVVLAALASGLALSGPIGLLPEARAFGTEELARAEERLMLSDYRGALEIVRDLLDSGALAGDDLRDAYVLLARCHVGRSLPSEAVEAFCTVLRLDPRWRPGPTFDDEELRVLEGARRFCGPASAPVLRGEVPGELFPDDSPDLRPEHRPGPGPGVRLQAAEPVPWYRGPWVLAAVGGVATGLLLLTLTGADDHEVPALPDFPPPPRE